MTQAVQPVADSHSLASIKLNEHEQLSFTSPRRGASVTYAEGRRDSLAEILVRSILNLSEFTTFTASLDTSFPLPIASLIFP